MPRPIRHLPADVVCHVINRGNCRMKIFDSDTDFASFIKLLEEARKRFNMRILAYCLMGNHWHLVLFPRRDRDVSRFMQWLSTTHVRRWREHRRNVGQGHLYQGRFKSFPVESDEHLLTLIRYVEANPKRAKLVRRAEQWLWSSLHCAPGMDGVLVTLTDWPVDRPSDWLDRVNEDLEERTLTDLHVSIARGKPFGTDTWVKRTVKRLGLRCTIVDPWRPKLANKGVRRT